MRQARRITTTPYLTKAMDYVESYLSRWGLWAYAFHPMPTEEAGFEYNHRVSVINPNYEDDVAEFIDDAVTLLPPASRNTEDIAKALKLYYIFRHGRYDGGKLMGISESMFRLVIRDGQAWLLGHLCAAVRYGEAPKEIKTAFNWIKRHRHGK